MYKYPNDNNIRLNEVDLLKGFLVIVMVIFHCASIMSGNCDKIKVITNYFNFIPSFFLIITGFLVGYKYSSGVNKCDSVKNRLLKRSLKIGLLFIIVNITLYYYNLVYNFSFLVEYINTFDKFVDNFIMQMNYKLVAFHILYHISLFLFLSSFFICYHNLYKLLAIFIIIFVVSFGYNNDQTFFYLGFGMLGYLLGSQFYKINNKLINYDKQPTFFLLAVLSIFLIIYYLLIFDSLIKISHVEFIPKVAICLLWMTIFLIIGELLKNSKYYSILLKFGKYSLVSYMMQMFIIRISYIYLYRMNLESHYVYIFNVIISASLLYLFVIILETLRYKYEYFNKCYDFVFT